MDKAMGNAVANRAIGGLMAALALLSACVSAVAAWKMSTQLAELGHVKSAGSYRIAGVAWAFAFALLGYLAIVSGRPMPVGVRSLLRIVWWMVFPVLGILAFNWLVGRIFCHEWGCSSLLGF